MPDVSRSFSLPSPEATSALARRLAPHLRGGDVLLLEGGIGAGKTHFARSLIQSLLAVPEDVPSPTFTLVQTYDGPGFEIWHADLYRLSHPGELIELGLEDAFSSALCLVEWPDRMGDMAPPDALRIGFALEGESARRVTMAGDCNRWEAVLNHADL
ncbi:MAG: tRNA (adenosine(37)-N6)-threonylcarbamoyltransferase complex ATPase subunit type 1 TsaE [Pseudooceanicola sp.]